MKKLITFIPQVFEVLGVLFDKIPALNKLKGYRSFVGFIGLAVVHGLDHFNIGPGNLGDTLNPYLIVLTGLALNSSGRKTIEAGK